MRPFLAKPPERTNPFFVARRRSDPSLPFLWHFHAELELTLMLESRGLRFVGDSVERYGAGDLVLMAPHVPHTWTSDRDANHRHRCLVLQFGADLLPADALGHPALAPLRRLLADARRGVAFGPAPTLAARLERLLDEPPLRQLARLYELLDDLAGWPGRRILSTQSYDGASSVEASQRIETVCRFLHEHFRRPIRVAEIAAMAGMSESAFARFFRRSTGKSLVTYLNDIRVAHAGGLLVETERKIADVADACGFPSVSFFNRQFRRRKGLPPSEFRRLAGRAGA